MATTDRDIVAPRRRTVGVFLAIALGTSACSTAADTADLPAARPESATTLQVSSQDLPVIELNSYVDGPADLETALAESDLVVVGTVMQETPGARFYGGDSAEDPIVRWDEDVIYTVDIEDVVRGTLDGDELGVRWHAYVGTDDQVGHRTHVVEENGNLPPRVGGTYVFFLTDFGDPWGLRQSSPNAGVIALRDGVIIKDGTSNGLDELAGTPISDLPR